MEYKFDASDIKETTEIVKFLSKTVQTLIIEKVSLGVSIGILAQAGKDAIGDIKDVPKELKKNPIGCLLVLGIEANEVLKRMKETKALEEAKKVAAKVGG